MGNLRVLPLLSLLFMVGCVVPPPRAARVRPQPPAPCGPGAPAIYGNHLVISVPVNFTYTPRDNAMGSTSVRDSVLGRLRATETNGNTYDLQNGANLNFTLAFTINNSNEQYSGGVQLSGWGQGNLHYFSTSGVYNNPYQMITDLTDQAAVFIRTGWHDTRPQCAH